jgi:leucyl aminopeptidase
MPITTTLLNDPMTNLRSLFALSLLFINLISSPGVSTCKYDPFVAEMLNETSPSRWLAWVRALSGADPIQTENGMEKILTRSSLVLFEPDQKPSAFDYLLDELRGLGFEEGPDFHIHTYAFPYGDRYPQRNWKNIILTFPGDDPVLKKERVLLVAHMDSRSEQEYLLAPGADDNASGSAGLLEAAAILRKYRFDRTIHLIWFSGEEKSRIGSRLFVEDYSDWIPDIIGLVNMDMFAFDGDNDGCFEVHAGTLSSSHEIGSCVGAVIQTYDLDLTYDFIDDASAYPFSDHYYFWQQEVPAVLIMENAFYQPGETCGKSDRNYNYHTIGDTVTYINVRTGLSILKAAIGTAAHLAQPLGPCFSASPEVEVQELSHHLLLKWPPMENAEKYLVWSENLHQRKIIGETDSTVWKIPITNEFHSGTYKVVGVSSSGCQSPAAIILPLDYYDTERKPH